MDDVNWLVAGVIFAGAVVGFVALPRVVFALAGWPRPTRLRALPWVAVALVVVAWFLPRPELVDGTDTLVLHAVGAGAGCAVLTVFLAANLGWQSSLARIGLAFVVTAVLGTVNELGELALDLAVDVDLIADTSWDLLANVVGAMVTITTFEVLRRLTATDPPRP